MPPPHTKPSILNLNNYITSVLNYKEHKKGSTNRSGLLFDTIT